MKTKLLLGFLFISIILISNQAKAQENDSAKVNWSEYYPLHVGDFWVYSHIGYWQGYYTNYQSKSKIIKDTIMSDGYEYYKKYNSYMGGSLKDSSYERLDSSGAIRTWSFYNDSSYVQYGYYLAGGIIVENGDLEISAGGVYDITFRKGIGIIAVTTYSPPHTPGKSWDGAYINGIVYGDTSYSKIGVGDEEDLQPTNYALDQNYPNPFNPATNITFQLPKESFVSLVVYNMLGEKVETLLNEYRGVGKHTVIFDAHNLPSGIYFYTLQTQGLTETKKMLLLK